MSSAIETPDARTDLARLADLVDAYRVFYERPSDPSGVRAYVADRLARADSRFFIERGADGEAAGFAHLLVTSDTLALRPLGILEDLFVSEPHRNGGMGGRLLDAATAYARAHGFARLTLSTAHRNRVAQRLYLAHGFVPDQQFRSFNYTLD